VEIRTASDPDIAHSASVQNPGDGVAARRGDEIIGKGRIQNLTDSERRCGEKRNREQKRGKADHDAIVAGLT
jgi:hypothetical protein